MANKQEYFRAIGELLTATLRLKGRDVTVTQKLWCEPESSNCNLNFLADMPTEMLLKGLLNTNAIWSSAFIRQRNYQATDRGPSSPLLC